MDILNTGILANIIKGLISLYAVRIIWDLLQSALADWRTKKGLKSIIDEILLAILTIVTVYFIFSVGLGTIMEFLLFLVVKVVKLGIDLVKFVLSPITG